ncbi:MAG: hypothetical protein AAGN35_00510 [Bacteroidota bacterium]
MITDILQLPLLIESYPDEARSVSNGKYEVMINPSSFSRKSKIKYYHASTVNSTGSNAKLSAKSPESVSFKFTLDGTGVTGRNPDTGDGPELLSALDTASLNPTAGFQHRIVANSIKHFFEICGEMDAETHDMPFLKISWGDMVFSCRMSTADVSYELFTPGGFPLRATISASFCGSISEEKRKRKERKASPDLTHIRVVQEGDTLARLTESMYGTTRYLLDVARVNNLTNYRKLRPGTELIFPPLDKTATI